MPIPELTSAEWIAVRRRMLLRALKLTKSKPKAQELTDAAMAKAFEPTTAPWNPERHKTLADYLCDIVWSLHGHEIASYRVMHASSRLSEALDAEAPSSSTPDQLALTARDTARSNRQHAELYRRLEGDDLVLLLLERDGDDAALEPSGYAPGEEMPGEEPVEKEAPAPEPAPAPVEKRPNAEAASTRRALAKGYTEKEIKNARERLKRHALAVAREHREMEP